MSKRLKDLMSEVKGMLQEIQKHVPKDTANADGIEEMLFEIDIMVMDDEEPWWNEPVKDGPYLPTNDFIEVEKFELPEHPEILLGGTPIARIYVNQKDSE